MSNILQAILMILSALLIIVADSFIKKISIANQTYSVIYSGTMFLAYFLYFIQILIAIYIFTKGGELAIYTNLFIIFYSIFGILSGVLLFHETINIYQYAGIALALIGAVLMNIH